MALKQKRESDDLPTRLQSIDWSQSFTTTSSEFGRALFEIGHVQRITVSHQKGFHQIEGRVLDRDGRSFEVGIQLNDMGPPKLDCSCSCPVRGYCKHSVAVLLAAEDGRDDGDGEPHLEAAVFNQKLSEESKSWVRSIKEKLAVEPLETHENETVDHYTEIDVGEFGVVYKMVPSNPNSKSRGALLQVMLGKTMRPPSGDLKPAAPLKLSKLLDGAYPGFVSDYEQERLQSIINLYPKETLKHLDKPVFTPENAVWHDLVWEMFSDDVLVWQEVSGWSYEEGTERQIEPFWVMALDGSAETGVRFKDSQEVAYLFSTDPMIYFDEQQRSFGVADLSLPNGLSAADWLAAPILKPEELPILAEQLDLRTDDSQSERKEEVTLPTIPNTRVEVVDGRELKLSAHLTLMRSDLLGEDAAFYPNYFGGVLEDFAHALVRFEYDDYRVDQPITGPGEVRLYDGDAVVRLRRDIEAERKLIEQLVGFELELVIDQPIIEDFNLGEELDNSVCFPLFRSNVAECWQEFALNHQLTDWQIHIDESFYFRVVDEHSWYADLAERPENDIEWLEFDYGIEVEGKKISLLAVLSSALKNLDAAKHVSDLLRARKDEMASIFVESEGLLVPIPKRQLGKMLQGLLEILDQDEPKTKLHPLEAAQLTNQLVGFDDSETVDALRKLGKKIANFKGIRKARVPKAVNAELRPYQREGLSWLQFLREYQLNGILADDMGLGKTLQTLACLQIEKTSKRKKLPSLIVAPTSVVSNWISEAEKFTPKLKALYLQGSDRNEFFESIDKYDLVVTSYALLNRDFEVHQEQSYHYVILDEAQLIKNPKSNMARNACALQSNHRLCLTGTPMENHLGELWSLCHFLMPGFLGDIETFRKNWQRPIENSGDSDKAQLLTQKISPLLLRRTKDLVLKELPERTDILHEITLDKAQAELYESVRAAMSKKVRDALKDKGLNRSHIIVLDAMLKLRQICCHPNLLKIASAKKVKKSAKLEAFEELVTQQVKAGRRILVFSQFTSMISIIEKSLKRLDIENIKLTGSSKNRKELVDQFQSGEVPVFLISLKAGGSGLNLTRADCVIHYDPWWNPAVEEQATARAHRMGQINPVFVYRLVTKGSIEERIIELQDKKAELSRAILSGGEAAGSGKDRGMKSLTQDDLEMLFAPVDVSG